MRQRREDVEWSLFCFCLLQLMLHWTNIHTREIKLGLLDWGIGWREPKIEIQLICNAVKCTISFIEIVADASMNAPASFSLLYIRFTNHCKTLTDSYVTLRSQDYCKITKRTFCWPIGFLCRFFCHFYWSRLLLASKTKSVSNDFIEHFSLTRRFEHGIVIDLNLVVFRNE